MHELPSEQDTTIGTEEDLGLEIAAPPAARGLPASLTKPPSFVCVGAIDVG